MLDHLSRPIRLEYENAVYHVTARGNERREIYRDDQHRLRFLDTLQDDGSVEHVGRAWRTRSVS